MFDLPDDKRPPEYQPLDTRVPSRDELDEYWALDRYFPSSKMCARCGKVLEVLPLSMREWDCPLCGTHHDRDVNAAKNLLARALVGFTTNQLPGVPREVTPVEMGGDSLRAVPVDEAGSNQDGVM